MEKVVYQDGELIDNYEMGSKLTNFEVRKNNDGNFYWDYVGFSFEKNKLTVVYPKHFYKNEALKNNISTDENLELLFKVILKYNQVKSKDKLSDKYFGNKEQYQSDYPFEEFYKVYDYYKKYGIYKEEEVLIKKDDYRNISWKKTIQKSIPYYSNGNLIYLPVFSKIKNMKNVFVSECMIYVINHTFTRFPFFFKEQHIRNGNNAFDFLENKEYTLKNLREFRNKTFKDKQLKLIDALIGFFEKYEKSKAGNMHLKIKYFDLIWEEMVNRYLNDWFCGCDFKANKLFFYKDKKENLLFQKSKVFKVDGTSKNHLIIPDHYAEDENFIYVFDSKYYQNLDELNYKQLVYTMILGSKDNKNVCSALILPGDFESGLHFKLVEEYSVNLTKEIKIYTQYLNVKEVMLNYLGKPIFKEESKIKN